jgi:hypothetical protein
MSDDQIFGVVASLALLIWLLSGRMVPARHRRTALYAAFGILGAGMLYALYQTLLWFAR